MKCSRCGEQRRTLSLIATRPGGHTWTPITTQLPAPELESVCGSCLTDDEIVRQLSPVMDFVLGVMAANAKSDWPEVAKSLEMARTYFVARNNNPDGCNRKAAEAALYSMMRD